MVMNAPTNLEEIRLYNIVDMGLRYSGMVRLYEKGTKQKLIFKIVMMLPTFYNADSSEAFDEIHSDFCRWATNNIFLAEKRKNGIVIRKRSKIGYGQAAKTIDVTLKVLVYYCSWPNKTKSQQLRKWIHAAIDNKMMRHLKRTYPAAFKNWPKSVAEVGRQKYLKLQKLVKQFISEDNDKDIKLSVEFDDKYWYLLKEGLPIKNLNHVHLGQSIEDPEYDPGI
jgi:hypothetical protein